LNHFARPSRQLFEHLLVLDFISHS
jgi:hypothetical protein